MFFRLVALAVFAAVGSPMVARTLPDEVRIKLEALDRLKGTDLQATPSLQAVVIKLVAQARGEPEFVMLVNDFHLPDQEVGLAEFVQLHPTDPAAVDALRLLLASTNSEPLRNLLGPAMTNRPAILKSMGDTADRRICSWIQPLIGKADEALAVRQSGVQSLARVREGAQILLDQQKSGQLPLDLSESAARALRSAPWPEVRRAAETLFPAPSSREGHRLPPISELVQIKGDPIRGAAIFRRADVACIQCHQVNGEGVNFGPALSEIGSKLGKEALCVAILEPSAGISFGFEAWNVVFKDGDEVLGLITGETDDELAVKAPGGMVTRYKKSTIVKREKQDLSIMPAGLEGNMSTPEFVDLIEYLASLKKAAH